MAKSFLLPALLAVTTSNLGSTVSGDETPMIVGGSVTQPGVYPYYVQVSSTKNTICGGTLIAPDVILTAAHCGWEPGDENRLEGGVMTVGAYELNSDAHGAARRTCDHYVEHPDYVPAGEQASDWHDFADYDYALCKLDRPVDMDGWDIELVLNDERNVPVGGEMVKAIGLGRVSFSGSLSSKLKHVDIPVDPRGCWNNFDNDIKICAGSIGQGICFGDSGGPLVRISEDGKVHTHLGISSGTVDCEQTDYPGFFARTSAVMDWIEDIVCNVYDSDASFCAPTLLCEDDEDFRWKTYNDRNCAWIRSNQSRIDNYCPRSNSDGVPVSVSCPETCSNKSPGCPTSSSSPSFSPSSVPSGLPSNEPSDIPSDRPSDAPTTLPPTTSSSPSSAPSSMPSFSPSSAPSSMPSFRPSSVPSGLPSSKPSDIPSDIPSDAPSTPSPTASISPSSIPSFIPSSIPSPTPALLCEDDETFQFKTFAERTCSWIASRQARIDNYCHKSNSDGKPVSESCPEACSSIPAECRCENDETFHWKTFDERTCSWIAERQGRIDTYCPKTNSDGVPVSESCPESCSSLPAECPTEEPVAPPPTEEPVAPPPTDEPVASPPTEAPALHCQDDETFQFKTWAERTCSWIASRQARIDNYCHKKNSDGKPVSESCPEACSSIPAECQGPRCENDETFHWKTFDERTCSWIAERQGRIDNYCHKSNSDGVPVSESCPEACSSMPAECTQRLRGSTRTFA